MEKLEREILASIFDNYCPLSNSSLDTMLNSCEIKHIKKGDRFSSINKPDLNEYFILNGIVHRFIFDDEGETVSIGFYLAKSVVTPHFARTVNGKSIFHLQALTDVLLALMPVKILDSLRNSHADIRSFGLKVVEKELLKSLTNEVSYRSMDAKNRLLLFRDQYPNLENLIPHTLIASYLGVTPVSFSRLRNELAKR